MLVKLNIYTEVVNREVHERFLIFLASIAQILQAGANKVEREKKKDKKEIFSLTFLSFQRLKNAICGYHDGHIIKGCREAMCKTYGLQLYILIYCLQNILR